MFCQSQAFPTEKKLSQKNPDIVWLFISKKNKFFEKKPDFQILAVILHDFLRGHICLIHFLMKTLTYLS